VVLVPLKAVSMVTIGKFTLFFAGSALYPVMLQNAAA
jgi:hypothetical protein